VKYDTGSLGQWVHQLEARAPQNKVTLAIANKLARIAWALLSKRKGPVFLIESLRREQDEGTARQHAGESES
jgi:hypothetical protein